MAGVGNLRRPGFLELLTYTLERGGFRVVTARDGLEGLEAAEATQPDLIVLDIMMPRMDGIETTHRLRESAHLRLTPILMLTARTGEHDEIDGLDAGADDYLVKPVSPRLLVSRVPVPHTASRSCSREKTRPGWEARK